MPRPWNTQDDGALLRAAGREPEAFAEFYLRHEAVIAAYLRRRTRDPELTADLTAETFATALEQGARFAGAGSAVGWLLGIARNLHLHQLRRGRVELRGVQRLGMERPPLGDASIARLEALLDARADAGPVSRALADLPPAQREAVLGFVVQERSYAELAAAFDAAEATVRQRVSRGLHKLRAQIQGEVA